MIVKAKVMLYIRTYRDETLKDLHRKIDDLQRNNDHWKNKAKDLERRMLELTVLQQKHEKRKAKTAALRVNFNFILLWMSAWFVVICLLRLGLWRLMPLNNISVILWQSALVVEEPGETTNLSQVTDKLSVFSNVLFFCSAEWSYIMFWFVY